MHIAVIQHVLRGSDSEDAVALANAALDAADYGANVIIFPRVPVLADTSDGDPVKKLFFSVGEEQNPSIAYINPSVVPDGAHFAPLPMLGGTGLFVGDAALDYQELLQMNKNKPQVAILAAGAENDMQAEALDELALGLSNSLCGLVIVAEAIGAEPGEPGHGGSVIVQLGEVVAEAMGTGDETLSFIVDEPIPQPEPRGLLPEVPTILSARLAHHLGKKPEVDYPADLS